MLFSEYAERWLIQTAHLVRRSTLTNYRWAVRLHLAPRFGAQPLRELRRVQCLDLGHTLLQSGLAPGSVRLILTVLRAICSSAVDDEVIPVNPCARFGKRLRTVTSARVRPARQVPDREEVERLLHAAREVAPQAAGLFLFLARTGCRIGEALRLEWSAVDLDARLVLLGEHESKTVAGQRLVDLSAQTVLMLRGLPRHPHSPLVFWSRYGGGRLDRSWTGQLFHRAVLRAGLPPTLTLHALRHSHASQLLRRGEPLQYVSRSLGHASVHLTLGLYGAHLPNSRHAAVDGLDE